MDLLQIGTIKKCLFANLRHRSRQNQFFQSGTIVKSTGINSSQLCGKLQILQCLAAQERILFNTGYTIRNAKLLQLGAVKKQIRTDCLQAHGQLHRLQIFTVSKGIPINHLNTIGNIDCRNTATRKRIHSNSSNTFRNGYAGQSVISRKCIILYASNTIRDLDLGYQFVIDVQLRAVRNSAAKINGTICFQIGDINASGNCITTTNARHTGRNGNTLNGLCAKDSISNGSHALRDHQIRYHFSI